jgi:hypothetical protein
MVEAVEAYRGNETPSVKNRWFLNFWEGNLLWPRRNEGINIFTVAGLLSDPPNNWQAVNNSRLSPVQLRLFGESATKQHLHYGVQITTPEYAEGKKGGTLTDDRLQRLWQDSNHNAMGTIAEYIIHTEPWLTRRGTGLEGRVPLIQKFFEDPHYAASIDKLKNLFQVGRAALLTPDAKELATLYRNWVIEPPLPGSEELTTYVRRYRETFGDDSSLDFIYPQNGVWRFAVQAMRDVWERDLPYVSTLWLKPHLVDRHNFL